MDRILRILSRESVNINQAAITLGFFTLLSQILALFRDRSIAHFIGPSPDLDAYYAAFRLPDLIFITIASLVSATALIPFIAAKMSGEQATPEARKYLNDIFTVFFLAIISVSVLAFILMPLLAPLVAPGFAPPLQVKLIILSRIMLLSPILLGLSNLFGSVTQIFRKFFLYALSPVFYNLGIIIGVVVLHPIFGIYGLTLGVALGALMHFGIQAVSAKSSGFAPAFSFQIDWQEVKKVALTSLPRTLGLAMNNLALIAIIALASFLKEGSISVFNFAFNLQSVPLNIIGISYAVAAFPTLAKAVTAGRLDEFKAHLTSAARAIVFWSLPVIFLFVVVRAQIVRVILGTGSFSWEDTRLVAAALAIFSVSILAQGMITLLSRSYYALGNTRRPLLINFVSSIFIVILSFALMSLFENFPFFRYFIESMLKVSGIPGTEVLMLPLAYSIGAVFNFILQAVFAKRDFMANEPFVSKTFFQSLGASFFLGLVAYIGLNIFSPIFGTTTFLGVFLQGFVSGLLGIGSALGVLYLLKNEELANLVKAFKTKFSRSHVVASPQESL